MRFLRDVSTYSDLRLDICKPLEASQEYRQIDYEKQENQKSAFIAIRVKCLNFLGS